MNPPRAVCAGVLATTLCVTAMACGGDERHSSVMTELSSDYLIIASSPTEDIVMSPLENGNLEISHSRGDLECPLTKEMTQSWHSIVDLALVGEPEVREDLSLDPNTRIHGGIIAVVRVEKDVLFSFWQIIDEDQLLYAEGEIRSILNSCGADLTFEFYWEVAPQ